MYAGRAHREPLMALGQFASGVAHEINNPLATIALTVADLLDLARDPCGFGAESVKGLVHSLESIQGEIQRCKRIITHLQDLSQIRSSLNEPVDPNPLVSQTIGRLSARASDEGKLLTWTPDLRVGQITSDGGLLERLLLAVLVNALDAVGPGGHVDVATHLVEDGCEIRVEDDGCGITREHMERVFEPFFTTKAPGKGTGLGLAVGQVIIRKLQGSLLIDSAPGAGTIVRISLPTVPPPRETEKEA